MLLITTSTASDELFSGINIDDFEREFPKWRRVSKFLQFFYCNAHFKIELRRNGWR